MHGGDKFVVVDASIAGPGHGTQFFTTLRDLHRLDLLRPAVCQPVLQVNPYTIAARAGDLLLAPRCGSKPDNKSHL